MATVAEKARALVELACGPMPTIPKAYQHISPYMAQFNKTPKRVTRCIHFTGTQDNVTYRVERFINENRAKAGFRIINQTMSQACEGITVILTYSILV